MVTLKILVRTYATVFAKLFLTIGYQHLEVNHTERPQGHFTRIYTR